MARNLFSSEIIAFHQPEPHVSGPRHRCHVWSWVVLKTLENHDFQGLILLKDVHFFPTDRSLCKMFSEWRSCMACWHPLPAVLAFVEWVQCSDLNPPRLNGWIREREKQRMILMIAVEHVAWNVDSYMTYLQGFQILWLLESYGGILMWKLSNLNSSKWFSIILGTSITQSSSLWHHLDQWQNSNKITVPPGGLNMIEWNIVEFRWEQTDMKESGCGLMWTPVCLVLQNPGWLEHIPITSTMLLKGNLFPSMCWMKLYRIIFTTVCVLGAYQQTPTTGVPCTVQIAWFGQNAWPWKCEEQQNDMKLFGS